MKGIGLTVADKWLIGILLVIAAGGIVGSLIFFSTQTTVNAQIRVDGKLIKTIPLRPGYNDELRIGGKTEYAIIEARDGKIRIRQDDSPRQIGVQTGWISKAPEQVVNLPYRIVITISSSTEPDIDGVAR